jgi:hypothetical protein
MATKKGKSSGQTEQVIRIDLTAEQKAQIKKESGGKLKIDQFLVRPDLNLTTVLERGGRITRAINGDDVKTGFAPPPQGSYWC